MRFAFHFYKDINRFYTVLLLVFFNATFSFSATLKGFILDENKEPMIGANVLLTNTKHYAVVGLDGSFIIKNIPEGSYTISVSYIGYKTYLSTIEITNTDQVISHNIALELSDNLLNEIIISGVVSKNTEASARKTEQAADYAVNIVSAKMIEISPDITVSDVIGRMSSVTMERSSNGDAQYAVVRGMPKRYNYTLVNRVKIPSPHNKNRYVPLDIFPAELMDRIEVNKGLLPQMEGDAIGGSVNMVLKKAPHSRVFKANLQGGYNAVNGKQDFLTSDYSAVKYESPWEIYGSDYSASPEEFSTTNYDATAANTLPDLLGGITYGQRLFGSKLGFLVSGSFQNSYRGTKSTWFKAEVDRFGSNKPFLKSVEERTYSDQQTRWGVHSVVDYIINKNNSIDLYASYISLDVRQIKDWTKTALDARSNPDKGSLIQSYNTRSRTTNQNILSTNLSGNHQLTHAINLKWRGLYAKAQQFRPDFGVFERNAGLSGGQPIPVNVERRFNRVWQNNADQDLAGYLDLTFSPKDFNGNEIGIGGLYRTKTRTAFYNKYIFDPSPARQVEGEDWNAFSDVTWRLINPKGQTQDERNFDAHENILAIYTFGKLRFGKLNAVIGVRYEDTDQGYTLRFPKGNQTPEYSQLYGHLLPSLQLKYVYSNKTNIRASYYKAISRPGFYEIVPYEEGINTESYKQIGNPDLVPAEAQNFDLRFEYYPTATNQLLAGIFYKNINNPIEETIVNDGATNDWVIQPTNTGQAQNWGFELDFTWYLNKLGFKTNYTYTNSTITTFKAFRRRVDPNDPTSDLELVADEATETRPLQGQARHLANFSLLYKDMDAGFDAQVALSYTGEKIEQVSQFINNDQWTQPITTIDLSIEQKIGKSFTVFGKVKNLLNAPFRVIIKQPLTSNKAGELQPNPEEFTLVREDYYYQSFRLGIRFKL